MADDESGPLYRAIKEAGRQSAEPVAAMARERLPSSSGDHAGQLRADVRVSGTKSGATVRMGRKSIPYAGWVEFGGTRHSPHDSSREYVPGGRYLFPAAKNLAMAAGKNYGDALNRVLNSPSVWTNTATDPGIIHD